MRDNQKNLVRHSKMTEKQEMTVASQVGELLHVAYPGYVWRVTVLQGVVTVHNAMLSGQWGFLLKIASLDPEGKVVVRAGGELLERYNLTRAKNKRAGQEEMKEVERDFRGEAIRA